MKFWLLILLLPGVVLARDDPWADDAWGEDWGEDEAAFVWSGFLEAGLGSRFSPDDRIDDRNTLEDLRGRVETEWAPDDYSLTLKADVGYDGIEGEWFGDFRDLSLKFRLGDNTDVSFGRQVHTWGTGDLVFLNDLFPKDFVSFFAGRDDEYLKAPANTLRITRYSSAVNVDFVWTPIFEPDVYLTGERFSFWSPLAGEIVALDPPLRAVDPDEKLGNGEYAVRLFRTIKGSEYAIYGYRGFTKQPGALTDDLRPTFARLTAAGASVRRPLGPGLVNSEFSYHNADDDQWRFLAGYEWEAKTNFSVGLQYYLESGPDEDRHVLTNRLTYRAGMDKYTWSLFTFWSPDDADYYLRPQFTYRHSDRWSMTAGGNLFGGNDDYAFFGQLQDGSNAYLRVRFNY